MTATYSPELVRELDSIAFQVKEYAGHIPIKEGYGTFKRLLIGDLLVSQHLLDQRRVALLAQDVPEEYTDKLGKVSADLTGLLKKLGHDVQTPSTAGARA